MGEGEGGGRGLTKLKRPFGEKQEGCVAQVRRK